ncbi:MAG TPA: endonuclease domain-containing protein [Longimicrobiaceae bacterium]
MQLAARALRAAMTPAEQVLWRELRRDAIDGLSFRRQFPVSRYILDFYCPARQLAIEVDGGVHDTLQERDAERTAALALRGIRVIRFRNEEVLEDVKSVVERIRLELRGLTGDGIEV